MTSIAHNHNTGEHCEVGKQEFTSSSLNTRISISPCVPEKAGWRLPCDWLSRWLKALTPMAISSWSRLTCFFAFLGPGAIISVAYVDPDNYQTAISSGASFQYKLLFMVLISNLIGIYLQVCRDGTMTITNLSILAQDTQQSEIPYG